MLLEDISAPITTLAGIGGKTARHFHKLGIRSVGDLLQHYPRDYEDRSTFTSLAEAHATGKATTVATITLMDYIGKPSNPVLRIFINDGTELAALVCFGRNFLSRKFSPGMKVFVSGQFEMRYGKLQSTRFIIEPYTESPKEFGKILPIYPTTEDLPQTILRSAVQAALRQYLPLLDDPLPPSLLAARSLPPLPEALAAIHFPPDRAALTRARTRLIYQELFFLQVIVVRAAMKRKTQLQAPVHFPRTLQERVRRSLPFPLTPDQEKALEEIYADTTSPRPMARLLQGDVGSGKTLVALLAALPYIEAGHQVAFMVPTELLALQHAETAHTLLSPFGIRTALLAGTLQPAARRTLLSAILRGEVDLVIGTHTLFSDDVAYRNLRLVIIDEQHKFGVSQRARLLEKASHPDLLLMTATPIPRTMALTLYGDMDMSTIKTMPPGRKPVRTHLAVLGKEEKVYTWVEKELEKGHQAYFVYPLIGESEKLELRNAESMVEFLRRRYPRWKVALIHSRIPDEEKERIMREFMQGTIRILVATSVIEVGVNVPTATCIVIEHAERFGLATLHQLRGRVGRSDRQSYAFLVYSPDLTEEAKARLRTMKETTDGFLIAEKDLEIRGPGDLLDGTIQAGHLRLRIAHLTRDAPLMHEVRKDVEALLARDPGLLRPEHTLIRTLIERTDKEPAL
ncbi:ATP-dependent DNA helicase RecG [Spirochaeta thermophila]|uniref:ATP-dependent DNA helicase RecG n=1 Tax=Winmispira thermophila (strain ATCC 49972 / DSM 6192 / RI 19.B1) TaxID=665571 RepID=E0RRW9_WINT6|nr:ATP-dependent DNA helicase RecG [Spirochaeta thermophila]ADN01756.1 ATP-dependent DNA helicase RecG [Spirochaeta thermophila DSM 6192]